jgi:hypothetical protein
MVSWHIWRALLNSAGDLFDDETDPYVAAQFRPNPTEELAYGCTALFACGFFSLFVIVLDNGANVIARAFLSFGLSMGAVIAGLFFTFMALLHTLGNLNRVLGGNRRLAQEYERRRFDLLSLMPIGGLGVALAAYRPQPHPYSLRTGCRSHVRIVAWTVFLAVAIIISRMIQFNYRVPLTGADMLGFVGLVAALSLLYAVDYVQSTAFGLLSAILPASYLRRRIEAPLVAAVIYLLLQIPLTVLMLMLSVNMFYLIFLMQGFSGPDLERLTQSTDFFALTLITAGLFALRELLIFALWRVARRRLNVSPTELTEMINENAAE